MREQRIQLWLALVALAIGATMLHYKLHPPQGHLTNFWATLFCSIDLVVVSILFLFRSTALWGLLLNSFLAFLGIIMMSDLTIVSTYEGWIKVSPRSEPLQWLLESMLPDISILAADFLVGLALYRITLMNPKGSSSS
ncbi:MAG TPA: hypothetical protein VK463_14185 [Desulfomonilaceae bacterium]|nr:hypothetical protein [Desulfomonilaceae bacterium]